MERSEMETTINWSRAEETASVYSSDPAMIRKLQKNQSARLVETYRDDKGEVTGMEFEVPVGAVKIRSGKRKATPANLINLQKARDKRRQAVGAEHAGFVRSTE